MIEGLTDRLAVAAVIPVSSGVSEDAELDGNRLGSPPRPAPVDFRGATGTTAVGPA